jgi:cell division septation protein DedD
MRGIAMVNVPVSAPVSYPDNVSGEYSVQVGFFSSSANANNFKNTLLRKDYPAYVESCGSGFRVKVGKFKSQKEVLDLENKLSQDGFATKVCP